MRIYHFFVESVNTNTFANYCTYLVYANYCRYAYGAKCLNMVIYEYIKLRVVNINEETEVKEQKRKKAGIRYPLLHVNLITPNKLLLYMSEL